MNICDFDFTSTVKDYEFTKKAVLNLNYIMDLNQFREMDADAIFDYLKNEMEIVSFKDYLKRYIYEVTEIEEPFRNIDDSVYVDIIMSGFEDHECPHAFTPTKKRWGATVKDWLKRDVVARSTVFLLGFGLGMTDVAVSDFLTKVLKEEDYDLYNVEEVIYWYCAHTGSPYAKALELMAYAEGLNDKVEINANLWHAMQEHPVAYLSNENNLRIYLQYLKQTGIAEERDQMCHELFVNMYKDVCYLVANNYWQDWDAEETEKPSPEDVLPANIEAILYSGVPLTKNGNLEKMSVSLLSELFLKKRLHRKRIIQLLEGKQKVERFDLITMMFLKYAIGVEPDWPAERYIKFVEEINPLLEEVGMIDIYPVNPYEAFVLMCIISEYPLDTYSQVWEKSYDIRE